MHVFVCVRVSVCVCVRVFVCVCVCVCTNRRASGLRCTEMESVIASEENPCVVELPRLLCCPVATAACGDAKTLRF